MGLSSKKTTSKTTPHFKKEITGAANTVTGTYNNNIGRVQDVSELITSLAPGMAEKAANGDAGVNAARDYNVGVLQGDYLGAGNPYLDQMIEQSNDQVRNQSQVALGSRGLAGTSDYQGIIADRVSKNDLGLRYDDYNQERNRMATAAGQSPGLAAADYASIAPLLGVADASMMPMQAASGYGATIGGLLGPYTDTTQKTSGGFLGDLLLAGVGSAGSYFGAKSDLRLKENIRKVGEFEDGLGIYDYNYIGESGTWRGVMAQDVAKLRPHALGVPTNGGFMTVNYGALMA